MPCRFAAIPLLVALALPVHSAIDVPPPPAGSEEFPTPAGGGEQRFDSLNLGFVF
jgi:hypothetical protein